MIHLEMTRLITEYLVTGKSSLLTEMKLLIQEEQEAPTLQQGLLKCKKESEVLTKVLRKVGYLQLSNDDVETPDFTIFKDKMLRVHCPDHQEGEMLVLVVANADLAHDNLLLVPTGGQ